MSMQLAATTRRAALALFAKGLAIGSRVRLNGAGHGQMRVRFAGRTFKIRVRPGTIDAELVRGILQNDSEYRLPEVIQPRVIFDIGANIGVTALYYAALFPDAEIYCFEPLPENLELLRANTACFGGRIRVLPFGLSDRAGEFEYRMSNDPRNLGGGGFTGSGTDASRTVMLPLRTISEVMAELNIERVDLFKIDTEGSELPILRSIPEAVRANTQAFIGELHGVGDWEACRILSETHALGVQKRYQAGCFPFLAVRRELARRAA